MANASTYHNDNDLFDHASSLIKIAKIFDPGEKHLNILDLGCGDGRLSGELVKKGHRVTGLDSNQKALKEAQKKGLKTINADIEKDLPIQTASFDAVFILDVLEHLYDQQNILKESSRALKDKGKLYIACPNHFDLRNRLNMLFGHGIVHWDHKRYENAKAWQYGHIRFLLLPELLELLKNYGFYPAKLQFNFMSGGLVPTRLTPEIFRSFLTKTMPELFSGKFILEAVKKKPKSVKKIYITKTIKGI